MLPHVDPEREARKFVAIDIESGDFEVSESERHAMDATRRLLERRPEAKGRIWYRRVGSTTSHRIRNRAAFGQAAETP